MLDLYNQFKDFKSLEVVFQDSQKNPQKIFCTVKSIEASSLVLNAINQDNKNIFASVGDELKLYIYTETGVYSAVSKILLMTKGILNTEYIIAYPTNSKHSQRREYFRAELNVDFHMCILTSVDPEKNLVIDAKTRNICGKGMSFIANDAFPEHEAIELDLFFEDEKIITTAARLVYSKQIMLGNKPKFVHAFTFTDISQRNIDFIVKKCFLRQLELKKKQLI